MTKNLLIVYEGSQLSEGQVGSVIYPGPMQYPEGLEVDILNHEGRVLAEGTVTQSCFKKFDHISNYALEDAFHPCMRQWGNAHEALNKEYPEFGLADIVTLVRVRIDTLFVCPLGPFEPLEDFTDQPEEE